MKKNNRSNNEIAADRAMDLIADVIRDADRKGIDPKQHLLNAMAALDVEMPSAAFAMRAAILVVVAR